MTDALQLYERQGGDQLHCDWCGRPGEALPFHVQSPTKDVEFAEPVLCRVCQGLIGYHHPHRTDKETHEWAAGIVSRLLTERFVSEGRPRPAWATGWVWPPSPRPSAPSAEPSP